MPFFKGRHNKSRSKKVVGSKNVFNKSCPPYSDPVKVRGLGYIMKRVPTNTDSKEIFDLDEQQRKSFKKSEIKS